MQLSGPPLIAVATGIVGSAWASGAIMAFSVAGAPAAKDVPQATARVWSGLYARGASLMPKVAAAVALSYAYAAYETSARGGRWTGFAAAAASVLAIVPFTLTCMKKTNATLQAAADASGDAAAAAQVPGLVDTWSTMNFVRGLFPLVGTVLGIQALCDNALWRADR
ncbi:hypothetical protein CDD83_5302 [Cordyceps sp. RAO-2017]|nr:hypothetical protein CDD83_5302 [Cordyceps sp. RAO-2017]